MSDVDGIETFDIGGFICCCCTGVPDGVYSVVSDLTPLQADIKKKEMF